MTKDIEERIAALREKYKELPPEKQAAWAQHIKKKNFINYKRAELIKSEILRLEARRAQLELCEKSKELAIVEKKIRCKKEKLLRCLGKQLDSESTKGDTE